MRAEGAVIAFFGAMTLQAKELRSALESSALATAAVKLYDAASEGAVTEFAGEAMVVTAPDEESILGLDIGFLCGTAAEMAPYLDWPARRGFTGIDLSGASLRGRAPLVHCDVNPSDIADDSGAAAPVIGVPHPVAHNLVRLVAAARAAGRIASVEAVALRPAAELGDPGIDELYQQTVALLNFAPLPQEVFGRQMSFNVIPPGGIERCGSEASDGRIHAETVRLLGMEAGQLSIRSAFVPMFHGHAIAATLTFERPPELRAVEEALKGARGLRVLADETLPSPVDLAGEEQVAVFDLRADPRRPGRVDLWTFCDNLKGGSTRNAVGVAEHVIDLGRRRPS